MTEVVLVEAADTFTLVAVKGRLDAAGVGEAELKLTSQAKPAQGARRGIRHNCWCFACCGHRRHPG